MPDTRPVDEALAEEQARIAKQTQERKARQAKLLEQRIASAEEVIKADLARASGLEAEAKSIRERCKQLRANVNKMQAKLDE